MVAPADYSGTPLVKKLGLKTGQRALLLDPPAHFFDLLGDLPEGIEWLGEDDHQLDYIHLFSERRAYLEAKLPLAVHLLSKTGMLWVSWPKKTSVLFLDLDGNQVRNMGLDAGLVDTKVCAIDLNWSGQRFMYRVKDR